MLIKTMNYNAVPSTASKGKKEKRPLSPVWVKAGGSGNAHKVLLTE